MAFKPFNTADETTSYLKTLVYANAGWGRQPKPSIIKRSMEKDSSFQVKADCPQSVEPESTTFRSHLSTELTTLTKVCSLSKALSR